MGYYNNDIDYGDEGVWGKRPPRRDTLLDSLDRTLWKLVAREETHLQVFKMSDALSFFTKLLESHPEGDKCLLMIKLAPEGYEVTQVLLDQEENLIYKTAKACYGRRIYAKKLDPAVVKFMDGNDSRIMQNPLR